MHSEMPYLVRLTLRFEESNTEFSSLYVTSDEGRATAQHIEDALWRTRTAYRECKGPCTVIEDVKVGEYVLEDRGPTVSERQWTFRYL